MHREIPSYLSVNRLASLLEKEMASRMINHPQGKAMPSVRVKSYPQTLVGRVFANETLNRRPGRADPNRPQYSPFFFMALIVTVISSITFVGLLSLALGAG